MAAPTPYSLTYDFTSFQSGSPTTPLPADRIEIEFGNVATTTDEIIANLALIQRTDGALANNSVGVDQLRAEVSIGVNPAVDWVTLTNYVANDLVYSDNSVYVCLISHESGTFSTDLAAGRWEIFINTGQFVNAASASATAASSSETNASTSETNAGVSEVNAGVSAASASASAAAAASAASEGLYEGVIDISFADSPYVPLLTDEGTLYRVDASGGDVIINLSEISTYGEDVKFAFVKTNSANDVIVNRGGTDTINGVASFTIAAQYESNVFIGDFDNDEWVAIAQNTVTSVDFSLLFGSLVESSAAAGNDFITWSDISDSGNAKKITISSFRTQMFSAVNSTSSAIDTDNDLIYFRDASVGSERKKSVKAFAQDIGIPVLLETITASDDATIEFTSGIDATYSSYEVRIKTMIAQTDNTGLRLRTSSDNGVTYDNGASDYGWGQHAVFDSTIGERTNTTSVQVELMYEAGSNMLGNDTGEAANGKITLFNPSSSDYTHIKSVIRYDTAASPSRMADLNVSIRRHSAAIVNAVQLYMSSGNIASGTFELWGIK